MPLLRPVPMRRLIVCTLRDYEDKVLEELGNLGVVHLETPERVELEELKPVGKTPELDRYDSILRRIDFIISSLTGPRRREENIFIGLLKAMARGVKGKPRKKPIEEGFTVNLEEVDKYTKQLEKEISGILGEIRSLNEKLEELGNLKFKVELMAKYGVRLDYVGVFRELMVKAGLLNRRLIRRLEESLRGLEGVTITAKPATREEDFIVIVAPVRYRRYVEETLTLLNFEEFVFPPELPGDPHDALKRVEEEIKRIREKVEELRGKLAEIRSKELEKVKRYRLGVRKAFLIEDARSKLLRTGTLTVIHGWVPEDKVKDVEGVVDKATDGRYILNVRKPEPEEKTPVMIRNPRPFRAFELITKMYGLPAHNQIDPTPIIAITYTLMFGIMFGDIGQGLVFVLVGLLFARSGGRVLSRLGRIMIACGLCSTVFGFLYGEFFLMETEELFHFHPLFVSPIHDVMALIKVALIFGIVHITIGLTLGMINAVSRGEMLEAVLGDKGVMGLVFYLGGVALVLASNLDINKFLEHPLLCGVVLTALLLIFLRPTIEAIHRREGSVVEAFFMGFGTLLETFLGFLCNTISYARLAAFALSHAALGLACAMLAEMVASPGMGAIVYALMNLLVILLEGLSVSIQALRLTFYEFATKVYIGGEVKAYRPLTLPKVNIIK